MLRSEPSVQVSDASTTLSTGGTGDKQSYQCRLKKFNQNINTQTLKNEFRHQQPC